MTSKQYFLRLRGGMTSDLVDKGTLRNLAATGRLTENFDIALSQNGPWHTVSLVRRRVVINVQRIGGGSAYIDHESAPRFHPCAQLK